jgi:arginase
MKVEVIAVPYDFGHGGQRMGAGPSALLEAGLGERLPGAGHQVDVRFVDLPPAVPPDDVRTAFEIAGAVAVAAREAVAAGAFPLVLSGNCGVTPRFPAEVERPVQLETRFSVR